MTQRRGVRPSLEKATNGIRYIRDVESANKFSVIHSVSKTRRLHAFLLRQ